MSATGKTQDMSSKIENEREMKIMFTKEELQLLKGLVKVSISFTKRSIRSLERQQQEGTITKKGKDMLKASLKSKEFKENLIKKLEELEHN